MPPMEPGAAYAVAGVFLGGLAIAGAVALVTAPITPRVALADGISAPAQQPVSRPRRPANGPALVPVRAETDTARTPR